MDVGCGAGTITLDVAAVVDTGDVTVIDAFTGNLEKARQEVRGWYENPEALSFNMLVFAAGRV